MNKVAILYPAALMMLLTLFLYVKNYLDNAKATKNKDIRFSHFKAYSHDVPEYVDVSRQTLKNQFELPILFYFLVSLTITFDNIDRVDIILAWLFVISRYIHCYIRLTANHVPYRAIAFSSGLFVLVGWWIKFLVDTL